MTVALSLTSGDPAGFATRLAGTELFDGAEPIRGIGSEAVLAYNAVLARIGGRDVYLRIGTMDDEVDAAVTDGAPGEGLDESGGAVDGGGKGGQVCPGGGVGPSRGRRRRVGAGRRRR